MDPFTWRPWAYIAAYWNKFWNLWNIKYIRELLWVVKLLPNVGTYPATFLVYAYQLSEIHFINVICGVYPMKRNQLCEAAEWNVLNCKS